MVPVAVGRLLARASIHEPGDLQFYFLGELVRKGNTV
jgi:hypothetical protein